MALTLAQANQLSNDVVQQGVIEVIVKESGILNLLPFIDMVGSALAYNREGSSLAQADFFAPGDTWTEGTPTLAAQLSKTLKILGGDADVDAFLKATRGNLQDIEAIVLELKAKAVAHEFEQAFIYGDDSVDPNTFDGLHEMVDELSGQQVSLGSGTTPAVLSLAKIDELVDLVKPGKPDFLLCSRRTRRGISKYARSLTSPITYEPNELGQRAMFFDGIPLIVSDFMLDTELLASGEYSAPTGGASSSMFAVKLGEGQLAGFTNGGVQVEDVGPLETKDARRWRVKFYCGLVLFSTLALARLDGISSGDVAA